MSTVLCYGDSLTWGYDPQTVGRHAHGAPGPSVLATPLGPPRKELAAGQNGRPPADRWPSVLAKALGPDVNVIAEGLNGRTTAYDDHLADCERNGVKLLPSVLESHKPLDLVILLLGTNDMKRGISGTAIGATKGIDRLVKLIRHHDWGFGFEVPEILIVAPPAICDNWRNCCAVIGRRRCSTSVDA
ncbi:MAG: hypothetical protein K0M55_18980 [Rhizobium sp.]|nr:hypothetical protein [Rhizobium sp.]